MAITKDPPFFIGPEHGRHVLAVDGYSIHQPSTLPEVVKILMEQMGATAKVSCRSLITTLPGHETCDDLCQAGVRSFRTGVARELRGFSTGTGGDVIVVGQSKGAAYAYLAALEVLRRWKKEGLPGNPIAGVVMLSPMIDLHWTVKTLAYLSYPLGMIPGLRSLPWVPNFAADRGSKSHHGWLPLRAGYEALQLADLLRTELLEKMTAKAPFPTAVFYGSQDRLVSRAGVEAFARKVEAELIVLEGAGHDLMTLTSGSTPQLNLAQLQKHLVGDFLPKLQPAVQLA